MKLLGISGSPRKNGTTSQIIQAILNIPEVESEFVSLSGKKIGPCIECLACVKDNICIVKDDMHPLREKLLEADIWVVGGSNIFGMMNSLAHNFVERVSAQSYHGGSSPFKGKTVFLAGNGAGEGEPVTKGLEVHMKYAGLQVARSVAACGPVSCFRCGRGHECPISYVKSSVLPDNSIDLSAAPTLEKQPEVVSQIESIKEQIKHLLEI